MSVSTYTQRDMSRPYFTSTHLQTRHLPPSPSFRAIYSPRYKKDCPNPYARPRSCRLRSLPSLSHALSSSVFRTFPNLVTIGGSLMMVFLVNMVRSGRCASGGGGGLGGAFVYLSGGTMSGSRISSASESLEATGEVGVDMAACIDGSGSLMICEFVA